MTALFLSLFAGLARASDAALPALVLVAPPDFSVPGEAEVVVQNAACVVDRFAKLRFPAPKGGGIVIVAYPFIFSPS